MRHLVAALLLLCSSASSEEPKVILHLLGDKKDEAAKGHFWIHWCDNWREIEKTKIIEGADAAAIVKQLKLSLESSEATNMCGHEPIFGIIAKDENGGMITTSLCFSCNTWVKSVLAKGRRLKIRGKDGIENPLCLILRKHIALPDNPKKSSELE